VNAATELLALDSLDEEEQEPGHRSCTRRLAAKPTDFAEIGPSAHTRSMGRAMSPQKTALDIEVTRWSCANRTSRDVSVWQSGPSTLRRFARDE
jgi:hypothetical protein